MGTESDNDNSTIVSRVLSPKRAMTAYITIMDVVAITDIDAMSGIVTVTSIVVITSWAITNCL